MNHLTSKSISWSFLLLISILFSNDVASQNIVNDSYGKGLNLLARDSSFSIKFGFRFQTLYTGTQIMDTKSWSESLMIRRSRLKFEGFVVNPKINYKIELGLSNRDTGGGQTPENGQTPNILLDAVLKWKFAKGWEMWAGQTKLPGNRERVISSQKLQFVDRSLVNSRFNLDRDIGLQLHHKSSIGSMVFKQAVAVSTGEGRDIIISNPTNGRQFTGRIELLPMGEFTSKGDYFGSDLKRESSPKLSIGSTVDYNQNAGRSRGNLGSFVQDNFGNYVRSDLFTVFVDGMFKYEGLSLMSEYVYRSSSQLVQDFGYGSGIMAAGGYLFPSNLEVALRYTQIGPRTLASSIDDEKEYTLGISKYVSDHNLKIQSDLSYITDSGVDFLRLRVQCEVAF